MSFSIGSTTFTQWDGPPQFVKQHISILAKPGSSNVSAIAKGTHGDPFEVSTVEFYASKSDAQTAAKGYRTLIGAAAQTVTYAGVDFNATHAHKYLVQDVTIEDLQPIPQVIGLTVTLAPAWPVRARWTLVPIAV
jgi:hypothetical protein